MNALTPHHLATQPQPSPKLRELERMVSSHNERILELIGLAQALVSRLHAAGDAIDGEVPAVSTQAADAGAAGARLPGADRRGNGAICDLRQSIAEGDVLIMRLAEVLGSAVPAVERLEILA